MGNAESTDSGGGEGERRRSRRLSRGAATTDGLLFAEEPPAPSEGKPAAAARRRHQWAALARSNANSDIAPNPTGIGAGGGATPRPPMGGYATLPGNYRRYYPKEVRQRRAANQFFRSSSAQISNESAMRIAIIRPASIQGSPLPKKPRTNTNSFLSLSSCPEFKTPPAPSFTPLDALSTSFGGVPLVEFTGDPWRLRDTRLLPGVLVEEPTPRSEEAANELREDLDEELDGPLITSSSVDEELTTTAEQISSSCWSTQTSTERSEEQETQTPTSTSRALEQPISLENGYTDQIACTPTADEQETNPQSATIQFRLPEPPPAPSSSSTSTCWWSASLERRRRRKQEKQQLEGESVGPITTAVLNRGLTAKFRSISAWLLTGNTNGVSTTAASEDRKTEAALSGYSRMSLSPFRKSQSVCRSDSFTSWSTSWQRLRNVAAGAATTSTGRKRKHNSPSVAAASETSNDEHGSLNSLTDGRTPWPIPWLEAIFLPEYPNRGGPVTERNFVTLGTIAKGAFGKVYRVTLRSRTQNDTVFAMKVQNKADIIGKEAMQQIKDEISIHESLGGCQFVARLYASWQSRTKLYTVLQYVMGYGDLHQLWHDFGPFDQAAVKVYAAEIATALDMIHTHGVIFRDLKMENIVLDENGHVQIVDFGLAKWLEPGDRTWTICGTLLYMAPEIATGEGYDHSVDWWCLGVILYALLTGNYPFPGGNDHTQLSYPAYRPPTNLDEDGRTLIANLLCENASDRLQTLFDLKQEPFFRDVNFDQVADRQMHPFDYIPRMRHCLTCNSINVPTTEMSDDGQTNGVAQQPMDVDEEESISGAFDEHYFASFDYFDEKDVSGI